MAEILERGTPPSEYQYDLRCKECKTLARYNAEELHGESGRYNESYYTFVCPVCSKKNYITGTQKDEARQKVAPPRPERRQTYIVNNWDSPTSFHDK